MKKKQIYIVLFEKDGSLQIYSRRPEKNHFREDAIFYSCDYDTTVEDISDWIGRRWNLPSIIKKIK